MNPQFFYTLLFFVPFILLIIIGFCLAKKLLKAALTIFIIAVILFFGFSVKISPLDYFFNYNQEVDAKSINLGKYTITFGQTATEKLYNSYIKILNNETLKENIIEFDPKSGKYWNIKVDNNNERVCFNNSSKKLFCIDKENWMLEVGDTAQSIQALEVNAIKNNTINTSQNNIVGVANPWTDCEVDNDKADNIAGFKFDLLLSNYTVRAMNGMIEIKYPMDEFRYIIVRKALETDNPDGDISGVYGEYKIEKIALPNGVEATMRMDGGSVKVIYMHLDSGYYSGYSEEYMTVREAEGAMKNIIEYEANVNK